MEKKSDAFGEFSLQDARKLAESDAGQQLFALLQTIQGDKLKAAMDQAAAGNMEQVKKAVQELMASGQAKALIEKMRGDGNG